MECFCHAIHWRCAPKQKHKHALENLPTNIHLHRTSTSSWVRRQHHHRDPSTPRANAILTSCPGNDPELDPERATPQVPTKVIDKPVARTGKRNAPAEGNAAVRDDTRQGGRGGAIKGDGGTIQLRLPFAVRLHGQRLHVLARLAGSTVVRCVCVSSWQCWRECRDGFIGSNARD